MFDGIKNFFGWLCGIVENISAKAVAVATFFSTLFAGIAAGIVSLFNYFNTWLNSITSVVTDYMTELVTFSDEMSASGLFSFCAYLLSLDTAAQLFLRVVPSLISGFFIFWVAVFGIFCSVLVCFGVYVGIKWIIRAVTLGFGRV